MQSPDEADHSEQRTRGRDASGFDRWAETYDCTVSNSQQFPLLGYERTLDAVFRAAQAAAGMVVLDLGTGTGALAGRFLDAGCEVWGTDFSGAMLDRARAKHPRLHTGLANLRDPLPNGFPECYDRIVSSYALHHLTLNEKVALIRHLARDRLTRDGRIVIGDVSFTRSADRAVAREQFAHLWDPEEDYWAADEFTRCLDVTVRCTYEQVSPCAGVYIVEPMQERPADSIHVAKD